MSQLQLLKARYGDSVTVVANDTDILILLLHHFVVSMADIYIHMATTKQAPVRRICIQKLSSILGKRATSQLLVIHAISGCDTTSSLYGRGKAGVFRTITTRPEIYPLTAIIGSHDAAKEDIVAAGLQLLVLILWR